MHTEVVAGYRKSCFHPKRPPQQYEQQHDYQQQPSNTKRAPPPSQITTSTSTNPFESNSNNMTNNHGYNNTNDTSFNHGHNQPTSPTGSQPETIFHNSPTMTRSRYESNTTATSPRTRQESRDGNVQFTPSTNKFENVKLQAMHLWTSGVDLELQQVATTPKKKPNNTWLTNSEWGASSAGWPTSSTTTTATTPAAPAEKQQQQSLPTSSSTEYPSYTTSSSSHRKNDTCTRSNYHPSNESNTTITRSYAEATWITNTLQHEQQQRHDDTAWSPEQEDNTVEYIQPSPPPTPYHQRHINGFNHASRNSNRPHSISTTTNNSININVPVLSSTASALPPQQLPPVANYNNNSMMTNPTISNYTNLGVGKVPMLDRKMDCQMYQDLYVIESNLLVTETFSRFYQNLDEFLRQSPRMSSRTFGMLIKTLNSIALLEKRSSTQSHGTLPMEKNVFVRLIPNVACFMQQALTGYLEYEVLTPNEMMPVLDMCSKFTTACPRLAHRVPLMLMKQTYEQIKRVFSQQDRIRAKAFLDEIGLSVKSEPSGAWGVSPTPNTMGSNNINSHHHAMTSSTSANATTATTMRQGIDGTGQETTTKGNFDDFTWKTCQVTSTGHGGNTGGKMDGWWRSMPELPSLPDGKELLQQVMRRMKSKPDGQIVFTEDQLLPQIVNKIQQSDIPNIRTYLMIQYMLLSEEMCGPVQEAMEYHLKKTLPGSSPSRGQCLSNTEGALVFDGCTMYSGLFIYGTTFFPTVNEPVVVLHAYDISEVAPPPPKEGSFAVLIREKSSTQASLAGNNNSTRFARPSMTSHHDTVSVLTGTIVYGIVKKSAKQQQHRQSMVIMGVHLKESQLSMVDWTGRYTLMVAGANAATIMPVLAWYHLHCEQSSDTLTTLATRLLTPSTSKHGRGTSSGGNGGPMTEDLPDYLMQLDLDLTCILTSQFHNLKVGLGAKGKRNGTQWPSLPETYQSLPPSQRPPLYVLSPTQLSAVQHAMTHRISVISGGEGTGKTFLASKLVQLLHQALVSAQCFQPILILTKNETTLDSILNQVIKQIPDLVRLGKILPETSNIAPRQVVKAAAPNPTDPNRKLSYKMERQLAILQGKIDALWRYRQQVIEADPSVMATTIPPHYSVALQYGYTQRMNMTVQPNKEYPLDEIWQLWMGPRSQQPQLQQEQKQRPSFGTTYQSLNRTDIQETGQQVPPIMEWDYYTDRRGWIEGSKLRVGNISLAEDWPFINSKPGSHVRMEMKNAWSSTVKPNQVWDLSQDEKWQLQQRIIDALVKVIDVHISGLLTQQVQAAKIVEEARLSKWTSICRFSRVVGVTADFAAAHAKVIESLWPRIIIMDEAQSILESIATPFVFGSRVQHVIMIGDAHARQRPQIHNSKLKGDPKHLDISLFERWRLGGGYITRLEEQWRMCSDIVGIHDSLATPEADRKLLITAPIAGENKGDQCTLSLEGLEERAYLLDYQVPTSSSSTTSSSEGEQGQDEMDPQARHIIHDREIRKADADEARFVAHLAFYLYQQRYKAKDITILTVSSAQKILINMALQELIRSSPSFGSCSTNNHLHHQGTQSHMIANVEMVDQYVGKESHFVILSLAMPCGQPIPEGNISLALSRARSGLYIVGRIPELQKTGWNSVVEYMKVRGICGPNLKLKCQKHPDQITHVENLYDFQHVKNGGCSQLCKTLLDCGHVCEETCHHLKHSDMLCQKECNRPRPTGCTHACPNKCNQCRNRCPPCDIMTKMERPCGHMLTGPCQKLPKWMQTKPCREQVVHVLPCGHEQKVECHRTSDPNIEQLVTCCEWVQKTLPCGHTVEHQCCYKPICTERCPERLDCGHPCPERCGDHHRLYKRAVCTASCTKQLICGHFCTKGCANSDDHTDRCLEQCQYVCCHGYRCGRGCWKVCNMCMEPCPYNCEHLQCTQKCHEKCDRPPCNKHCSKTLDCGHACIGLCGEPCPPCKKCHPDITCSISLRTLAEFEDDELAYMLPECGCVFAVDSLDLYFKNQAKNGEHTAIKLWQCPSCQKPIYTALRYNMYIKTEIALVNQIKAQQEERRHEISQEEKTGIIQAMNEETKSGINNIVGGRWFVCENGHPYFIGDCGGATQISSCPHCGAVIGGLQHKVVESNRFYGEFDGSFQPAWPGQPQ